MRKINRFLIISPYSIHKGEFHFQKLITIFETNGIESRIIDSAEYVAKFFQFDKFEKHKKFSDFLDEYNPNFILLDGYSELVNQIIKKKIPFLFLVRGNVWDEEEWAKKTICKSFKQRLALKRKHRIFETCINNAFTVVAISNFLQNIIKEKFPTKKIKVVHIDARNPEEWIPQKGMKLKHPCVGLLQGAGVWGKTREMMILPEILEKMPHVMFYWAGDGIYRDKILPMLENFSNFKWLGNLKYPEEVKEFLSEIDVYALFSGMDGLGQTVIEASLMEKPVIATKSGGIPETIEDGKTGFLIETGDIQGWIEKISLVLNNGEASKKLGINGREFVSRKFSWITISDKIIEIIRAEN